jgi:hypothetical protein
VRKRCFKNGVSTALKVQLEESAVARAQEATDTQRLEQRRVNLLANVTHRVVAEAAEAKAQAAAQLGFDVKQQAKELALAVRKRSLFVTFLTIIAPTISRQPRDKRREESAWIRKEIVFAEDENCQVEPSEAAAVYAAAAVGRAARRAAGRASRGAAASEGAGPHADRARHSQVRKQHAFFCGRHFFAF